MTNNQFPRLPNPYPTIFSRRVGGQAITNLQTKDYRLKTLKIRGLWSMVFCLYFIVCSLIVNSSLFAQDTNPERIVSLGPAITSQLSILRVKNKIVGVTTYCNIEDKERIGTVMETNLEKTVKLEPDLVIATALTNPKTIQKLKSLNINVVVFDEVKNFGQLCEQFLNLSRLVNREQIGQEIILKVEERMANLQEKVRNLSKPKVIVQIGANPLWVATKSSLINDFIESAGGINIGPTGKNGLISREYVLKHNPDVIIIIEMGIVAGEEKEIWVRFNAINAVTNKRIHIIDSYKVCSPTPLSFVETLEEISQLLHPEIE